jgi:hypothetical protein
MIPKSAAVMVYRLPALAPDDDPPVARSPALYRRIAGATADAQPLAAGSPPTCP